MQIVNSLTAFQWRGHLDINGVPMRGAAEKQGHSFSRAGYLAHREDPMIDADMYGRMLRATLRPLSASTLSEAKAEYARREVVAFPRYFIIEPNASCNRKCVFCPITVTNRKGNLAWDDFTKLMDECGQNDVYGLSLYQLSEPMLYRGKEWLANDVGAWTEPRDIAHMVDYAKKSGFRAVNISTNGDADNLARLLECDLDDLIISIDGMTAEIYDQNRPSTRAGDTFAFDRTVGRVIKFLEAKAHRGLSKPFVRLQIINNALCAPQVLDFIRYWIDVPGVDDVFVKNLDGMNAWLGDAAVSAEESALKMAQVARMPCQHIYAIGSMVATGAFNACCHDAKTELTTAGANVREMSFADWWNGEYMTALRAEHAGGATRLPCAACAERDPWLGA